MASVSDIFDQLGGPTAIANETGLPLTTVHSWKRSGFVPAWRVPALVELAKRLDVAITSADFPQRGSQCAEDAAGGHVDPATSGPSHASAGKIDDLSTPVSA